jgi:hypothetical protein
VWKLRQPTPATSQEIKRVGGDETESCSLVEMRALT